MNETRKSGTNGDGLTKEELAAFRKESLHAIEGVKRRLHRERIARGVFLSGAAAVVVILAAFLLPRLATNPEAIAPQVAGHAMMARLVVPDAETETLQVFRAPSEEENYTQPVKLQPILDLKAGDAVTVAEGGTAVLYNWVKQTREKFFGPCRLEITERGVKAVKPGGPKPESEQARLWAMSLEPILTSVMRATPDEMPLPVYPVDTSVPPGEVILQWKYFGSAEAIELTVENEAGDVLLKQKLDASETEYRIAVNEDSSYYWKVSVPNAKAAVAQEFHVLGQTDWEWVRLAAKANLVTEENLVSGIAELTDKWNLIPLYEIFTHYQLYKEAEAVRQRLHEILSED